MALRFINSRYLNDPLLIGFEKEVEAVAKVVKRAVEDKTVAYVLAFGMPGAGKSLFSEKIAFFSNNNYTLGCSVLHFPCNEYLLSPDIDSIEKDLYQTSTYIEQQCPLILSLDELDYIAPERLRQSQDPRYGHLSVKLMGLLSSQFTGKAGISGGLVVILSTNAPLQLEAAVLDRIYGGIVYFPLPTREISMKILEFYKIYQPDDVYHELNKLTNGAFYTGRGLVEACKGATENKLIQPTLNSEEIARVIYRFLPPLIIDQAYLDRYRIDHKRLIQQAEAFLEI